MPQRRHVCNVRILRIDGDAPNCPCFFQSAVSPRFSCVYGFVNTISVDDVTANARLLSRRRSRSDQKAPRQLRQWKAPCLLLCQLKAATRGRHLWTSILRRPCRRSNMCARHLLRRSLQERVRRGMARSAATLNRATDLLLLPLALGCGGCLLCARRFGFSLLFLVRRAGLFFVLTGGPLCCLAWLAMSLHQLRPTEVSLGSGHRTGHRRSDEDDVGDDCHRRQTIADQIASCRFNGKSF